jgi:hypothetical protein
MGQVGSTRRETLRGKWHLNAVQAYEDQGLISGMGRERG